MLLLVQVHVLDKVQRARDAHIDMGLNPSTIFALHAQNVERAAGESLAKELLGMVLHVEETGKATAALLFPSLIVRAAGPPCDAISPARLMVATEVCPL